MHDGSNPVERGIDQRARGEISLNPLDALDAHDMELQLSINNLEEAVCNLRSTVRGFAVLFTVISTSDDSALDILTDCDLFWIMASCAYDQLAKIEAAQDAFDKADAAWLVSKERTGTATGVKSS